MSNVAPLLLASLEQNALVSAARVWSNDVTGQAIGGSAGTTAHRPTTRTDAAQAGAGHFETHLATRATAAGRPASVRRVASKVGCLEPRCCRTPGERAEWPALHIAPEALRIAPEGRRSIETPLWRPSVLAASPPGGMTRGDRKEIL